MIIALITAAGKGLRMGEFHDVPKQYLPLGGIPMLYHSVKPFIDHPKIDKVFVIISESEIDLYTDAVAGLDLPDPIIGDNTRQNSVRNGLNYIKQFNPDYVLIHDAARPFINKKIISSIVNELQNSRAVIPAIPIDDTIKKCANGKILWTVERSDLWRAQTPQGFVYDDISKYHNMYTDKIFTDDSSLYEYAGVDVTIVPGSQNNFKVTNYDDYDRAESLFSQSLGGLKNHNMKFGIGYDIHRFDVSNIGNYTIRICGVDLDHKHKIIAHSDGDVAVHAIIDGILGAISLGDIGTYFPNTDEKYKDIDSMSMLKQVSSLLRNHSMKINNIDINIITEKPKISPYVNEMKSAIASCLGIDVSCIGVKAKTNEGLDSIGVGEAIACQAIVSIISSINEKIE
jgi:2-C-methyl-D-erythritol 4-phosphate cytidylyltransferase/2-C-methyl-D-erythritol 2,4-cyclodiphosphate synthase